MEVCSIKESGKQHWGFTTNGTVDDDATVAPFSGVTVSDGESDNVSVSITGSASSYTVSRAAAATATANLQGLLFHPTANQVAQGSTVVTTFPLTPNNGTKNGNADSTTVLTATSVNDAPLNTVVPAISGTSTIGSQLTTTSGTWTDADEDTPTYSYQWAVDGIDIFGTTLKTYELTTNEKKKNITCTLIADDGNSGLTQYKTQGVNESGFPWLILMPALISPNKVSM